MRPLAGRRGLRQPLRVAVLLDALVIPGWIRHVIRQLDDADFTDLVAAVVNTGTETPTRSARRTRLSRLPHALWHIYRRIDYRIFRTELDAFQDFDNEEWLRARVEVLEVVPLTPTPYEHRFDEPTLRRLRALELDVIFRFGFKIIRGEILHVARYGVWSLHHDDNRHYRGSPALFWEMYERNPLSGAILQILTEDLDAGRVIYRAQSATDFTSWTRNRQQVYWKAAEFFLRSLRHLHERGWESIQALDTFNERTPVDVPIYRTPTNRQVAVFLARTAEHRLLRAKKSLRREQWFVGLRRRRDDRAPWSPDGYEPWFAPRDRFYADPFLFERDGIHFLFFEEYLFLERRGRISWCTVEPDASLSDPQTALELATHAAYPCVFQYGDDIFMVLERPAANGVELYRASSFPDGWIFERKLLDGVRALDPTVFEHDGRLWLFANIPVQGAADSDELFLFWAESLHGPWTSHTLNPVVSDVRFARPAGRIFSDSSGALIRPAQDCSGMYGKAVVFNHIEHLTQHNYVERPIARLGGEWVSRNLGTHTYSRDSQFEAVDGRRLVWGRTRWPSVAR